MKTHGGKQQPLPRSLQSASRHHEAQAQSQVHDNSHGHGHGHDRDLRKRVSFGGGDAAAAKRPRVEGGGRGSEPPSQRPGSASASRRGHGTAAGVDDGLSKTIHELLDNYVPASSFDAVPFFCRVCKFTAADEAGFLAHRQSELHFRLEQEERRRSECRLCRKQFTSPEQLKEHLKGAKHKEKLTSMRLTQQQQKKFC